MTKDEALKLALEALKLWLNHKLDEDTAWEAHNAIKEALKIKDEPVAWGMEKDGVILDVICPEEHEREEGEYTTPLYTIPQRTCVRLTKEEINEGLLRSFYVLDKARAWRDGVAWAEEILKEKNNAT